jgi:RNA polymerase sigma-70 factor (ECF subfamily)
MADLLDRAFWRVLVIRCQLGDAAAFAELVRHCQKRLRAFLFKMVPHHHNVDDMAQEVWVAVFRDLPRLKDPDAFLPWFYRIARNRAFRALRRKPVPREPIADESVAVEEEEFTTEDAQIVHASLDKLSPEHREVLLLRFVEELSYEEIAGVVDCPLGTVRSRVYHAKRQLRAVMESERKYESG